MPETLRGFARLAIVTGYALSAVGALMSFSYQASQGVLRLGTRNDIALFAGVFASFAGLFAWWILTRLVVEDGSGALARLAFFGLGLQALLVALPWLLSVIAVGYSDWFTVFAWFFGVGSLLSGAGFLAMSASYRAQRVVAVDEASDESTVPTLPSI